MTSAWLWIAAVVVAVAASSDVAVAESRRITGVNREFKVPPPARVGGKASTTQGSEGSSFRSAVPTSVPRGGGVENVRGGAARRGRRAKISESIWPTRGSTRSSRGGAAAPSAAKKGKGGARKGVKKMAKRPKGYASSGAASSRAASSGAASSRVASSGAAPPSGSPATRSSGGDTMPSIFRIPSEERYDNYAAALAVTEGLRRVRDADIERAKGAAKMNGKDGGSAADDRRQRKREADEAKRLAENAFLLQSTKSVKALGMTIPQFNQIGREVMADPALKERVSEQAYLYRMAAAVNLDRVPFLEDPSSKRQLLKSHHRRYRVQMFARSITEIEDLRADQIEELRRSLRVERFPPGFDLSDPNVRPLLHPQVRAVCEAFPQQAEEIVERYGLESEEFNRMLEETKGNPIFRWRVKKYVEKAEEERAKKNGVGEGKK